MDEIKNIDIAAGVSASLTDWFDAMLSMGVEPADEGSVTDFEGLKTAGTVRLTGKILGTITICVSEPFSRLMAAAKLGVDAHDITGDADVKDVVGLVCHAVGAHFISKIEDNGFPCRQSKPTYARGRDFEVEPLHGDRHERLVFTHETHPIVVDVAVSYPQESATGKGDDGVAYDRGETEVDDATLADVDLKTPVADALVEMFHSQLSLDLERADTVEGPVTDGRQIAGSTYISGQVTGSLNVHVGEGFSRVMAANRLGKDADDVKDVADIKDVMVSVCDALGGSLSSKLAEHGVLTEHFPSSMTAGTDFTLDSSKRARTEQLAFHHGDENVYVEVAIAVNTPAADEKMRRENGSSSQSAIDQAADPKGIPADGNPVDGPDPFDQHFEFLLDVPVAVTVELGRTRKKIEDVLNVKNGSIVELTKLAHEPVDIRVNDTLIAKGEIVVDQDKYGVRILETISRMQRIRSL